MIAGLRARYQVQLDYINFLMTDEVAHWPWAAVSEVEKVIRDQLARTGKQLRPLLALAVADLLGGRLERVCAPAASLEFYHLAALVLDDIQDNSSVRRGAPAVHTTASTSMGINIASTIRSLAYHPVHRCDELGPAEKLSMHRELDRAATELVLGQSIDIGWHLGWYLSYADFPYDQMIRWKTGSMFGCAAAMGARAASARPAVTDAARQLGISLGAQYQMIDDYLDVFGDEQQLQRPKYEDFRGRKMSGPVILLLHVLTSAGCQADAERISAVFAGDEAEPSWDWLVDMMSAHGIGGLLREQLASQAMSIETQMKALRADGDMASVRMILDLMMAPLQIAEPEPEPGHAGRVR